MTLETTEWRKWMCTGHLLARGVPEELIDYHCGHNGNDFDTSKEVCLAAIEDGFPRFRVALEKDGYRDLNQNIAAQFWSYLIMCREAVERNETIMWIHDDIGISAHVRWTDIQNMVSEIDTFDFILLTYYRKEKFDNLVQKREDIRTYGPITVTKGIFGRCDFSLIISPEGAKWILDHAQPMRAPTSNAPNWYYSFEGWIQSMAFDPEKQPPNPFSCEPIVTLYSEFDLVQSNIHDIETLRKTGVWTQLKPTLNTIERLSD